jgi:hypothetical protein
MKWRCIDTIYREYLGMNYEQASRAADELIKRDGWYKSFDRLAALHDIMQRDKEAQKATKLANASGMKRHSLRERRAVADGMLGTVERIRGGCSEQ